MTAWAPECYLLYGNHERFARDLVEKFPQFASLFDLNFMLSINGLKVKMVDYKGILDIGIVKFAHGDMKMFGAKGGQKLDKIYETFDENTVVGHLHTPTIRSGCYMVGMSGKLQQDYNEPNASSWMQGFGYINVFEDKAFITLVNIKENRCRVGKKVYAPRQDETWQVPKYKAAIQFDFTEVK